MCLVRSVCPFSFASHFAWYGQSLQFFGELRYDDTDRLLNTTENMLVATRLETGRDSFKMRPERVDGVLRAAVAQLGRQASEHKLSVVVNDPALTAVMDPELIRRVLPSNCGPNKKAARCRSASPTTGRASRTRRKSTCSTFPQKTAPRAGIGPRGGGNGFLRRGGISPQRAPTRNSGSRPLRCASE